MKVKRGHKTLTIKEKGDILISLEKGELGKTLAIKYGIGTSTISEIKRNKERILNYISSNDSRVDTRRTLKSGDFPKVEQHLYSWFMEEKIKKEKITTDMLIEKAKKIHNESHGSESSFKASKGWIDNFKRRFNIKITKKSGAQIKDEKQPEIVDPFECHMLYDAKDNNTRDSKEFDVIEKPIPKIKHGHAVECFNICLQYVYENQVPLSDILLLGRLRDKAFYLNESETKEKQTKITDFYNFNI